MDNSTEDQKNFLEECLLKFSDRFTDADPKYKEVLENGIPPPPIMYPWYSRTRFNNRDRGGRYNRQDNYNQGNQYNNYSDRTYSRKNYRERPY